MKTTKQIISYKEYPIFDEQLINYIIVQYNIYVLLWNQEFDITKLIFKDEKYNIKFIYYPELNNNELLFLIKLENEEWIIRIILTRSKWKKNGIDLTKKIIKTEYINKICILK